MINLQAGKIGFGQSKNNTKKLDTRVSFVKTYSPNHKVAGQLMKKLQGLRHSKNVIFAIHLFLPTTLLEKIVAT